MWLLMSPCFVFLIVITTLTVTGERQYSCTQFSAQNTQLYPLTYTPHSSLHHNHNCTFLQLSSPTATSEIHESSFLQNKK